MNETNGRRPNIIFILSDDQGFWSMGCAGNSEIETPNLDRLAASGMRFRNFFCASPVCSPARASLLTGRIPSAHGVHDWIAAGDTIAEYEPARGGELIEYLKGQPGYTDLLGKAGYTCGLSGKWHLGDSHHPQKGFTFWRVHAKGGGPYYNAPMVRDESVYKEPRYVTDAITDHAIQWLDRRKTENNPFYLSLHYTAPHNPWEREHHPADLWDRYFKECPFESVPDVSPPPDWVRRLNIPVESAEKRRVYLSGYYAAVTAMDRNIGRVIDWLEANGLREDTLVVFTSDNGMNMGHHGVYGKGNATFPLNMFEESVKVPFIVSHPGSIADGRTENEAFSHYDVFPTLLDYAGCDNPYSANLPGRSFAGRPRGTGSDRLADSVVIYDEYGPVRMIRSGDWKYVQRFSCGPDELYNLRDDPGELGNLADDPRRGPLRRELRQRMDAWFARYADPGRDGKNQEVTGAGQLGLCGRDADMRNPFAGL